eukprot:gene3074-3620_t
MYSSTHTPYPVEPVHKCYDPVPPATLLNAVSKVVLVSPSALDASLTDLDASEAPPSLEPSAAQLTCCLPEDVECQGATFLSPLHAAPTPGVPPTLMPDEQALQTRATQLAGSVNSLIQAALLAYNSHDHIIYVPSQQQAIQTEPSLSSLPGSYADDDEGEVVFTGFGSADASSSPPGWSPFGFGASTGGLAFDQAGPTVDPARMNPFPFTASDLTPSAAMQIPRKPSEAAQNDDLLNLSSISGMSGYRALEDGVKNLLNPEPATPVVTFSAVPWYATSNYNLMHMPAYLPEELFTFTNSLATSTPGTDWTSNDAPIHGSWGSAAAFAAAGTQQNIHPQSSSSCGAFVAPATQSFPLPSAADPADSVLHSGL